MSHEAQRVAKDHNIGNIKEKYIQSFYTKF
jgi:hypothetical protein